MALVIELRRGVPTARTGRKPGPRPAAGTLERRIVDDELWTALQALGRHLPTLTDVDPYGDTTLRGQTVDRMVRELEGADLAHLSRPERELLSTLLAWGLRCRADSTLRIAFSGD
ncbi:hypothetical protein E2C00_17200 [Streptomyces sp. WAC05374]|uniref:hypothetical protein n=1 Tax=Streptomyces sp. WAC05374 TaxID=2487420 RepID=UPI000F87D7A5|nr:hypothetical protein [Streptomyces sp. WAC05374]RST16519.1 hypothetical protein EF905_11935 [Streptomyces sp. WAC05374]TDF54654.1 hypothetical protein E2C00_17200 [Streptomyces sp. WAC05374]TDF56290.1 hypothetical protein E2C02_12655 [Streptomyces sp. WAC05374]